MPDALPAVTHPFLLNAAGSFASPSIVESGRMWSSAANTSTPLRVLISTGDDFLGEAARLPRGVRELLAAERVAILLLARDAVFRRAVLGRAGHRAAAVRVEKRRPEVVLELPLSEAKAVASPRMTCGAWLMLSVPPASTMSASPSRIIWPALIAD